MRTVGVIGCPPEHPAGRLLLVQPPTSTASAECYAITPRSPARQEVPSEVAGRSQRHQVTATTPPSDRRPTSGTVGCAGSRRMPEASLAGRCVVIASVRSPV
jgi:hypothetical protein